MKEKNINIFNFVLEQYQYVNPSFLAGFFLKETVKWQTLLQMSSVISSAVLLIGIRDYTPHFSAIKTSIAEKE